MTSRPKKKVAPPRGGAPLKRGLPTKGRPARGSSTEFPPDFIRENQDFILWIIGLWTSARKRKRRGLITPNNGNHEKPRPANAGNSLRKPR